MITGRPEARLSPPLRYDPGTRAFWLLIHYLRINLKKMFFKIMNSLFLEVERCSNCCADKKANELLRLRQYNQAYCYDLCQSRMNI